MYINTHALFVIVSDFLSSLLLPISLLSLIHCMLIEREKKMHTRTTKTVLSRTAFFYAFYSSEFQFSLYEPNTNINMYSVFTYVHCASWSWVLFSFCFLHNVQLFQINRCRCVSIVQSMILFRHSNRVIIHSPM